MNNETTTRRSSKRPLRMAVAAVVLGLMASLAPLATSPASARPAPTVVGISDGSAFTPNECFFLLFHIRAAEGSIVGAGSEIPDIELPGGDEEGSGREESLEEAETVGYKDRYRDLGCETIPGFPTV